MNLREQLDAACKKTKEEEKKEEKEKEVEYEDFSQQKPTREYSLLVEGRLLHVNGHWLAELSPYFSALFFHEFREKNSKTATMDDGEQYDHLLELLRCVMHLPHRKPIDENNIDILLDMADIYDFPWLRDDCAHFILANVGDMNDALVLRLLATVAKHKSNMQLLEQLLQHVSEHFPLDKMESLQGDIDADVLIRMYIIKSRKLTQQLEMANVKAARAGTGGVIAASGAKKRKMNAMAEDSEFGCDRCRREGRVPGTALRTFCEVCGRYRCSPKCPLVSSCKGH